MKCTTLVFIGLLIVPAAAQDNPDDGGPDYYEVHGVGGHDALNIRTKPSAKAAIVGRVGDGTFLKNGGCASYDGARWCKVTVQNSNVAGWASGKYLREGQPQADAKVEGARYHATGSFPCTQPGTSTPTSCDFGVIRQDNGTGLVEILLPDRTMRKIWLDKGKPVASDFGLDVQPGENPGDAVISLPDGERFMIPDVVVFGDP